jgi:hypothetical protein
MNTKKGNGWQDEDAGAKKGERSSTAREVVT